jgi:hypothetical protein
MRVSEAKLELAANELDHVSGGIIIVSGLLHRYEQGHASSVLDRVSLNPQPLPPKVFAGR